LNDVKGKSVILLLQGRWTSRGKDYRVLPVTGNADPETAGCRRPPSPS